MALPVVADNSYISIGITGMKQENPKAVFFDLDETLIENQIPVRDLFARMYFDFKDQLGEENQAVFFEVLRNQASTLWSSMFDTNTTPEQQFIDCFETCIRATDSVADKSCSALAQNMFDHYISLSSNNVAFHADALETLAELNNAGYITGIITNGIEQVQLGKIKQLTLQSKVDHITVSAQARAHKPFRAVFDLALSRAGVKPEQAWQIGDHATNDVAGAIRAGMSGVFYDPSGERGANAFAELDERPTHQIKQLSEVLRLLDT